MPVVLAVVGGYWRPLLHMVLEMLRGLLPPVVLVPEAA